MAKNEVKKRGRPPKEKIEPEVINEEAKQVTMAEKGKQAAVISNGVGTVREPSNNKVTITDLQTRWKQIFSNYSSLGVEGIYGSWNKASGFIRNNPFLQNERIKNVNSQPSKKSKEEIEELMSDPANNEEALRRVSWGLYYSNYVYYTLIQLNRNVPKYCCYYNPLYINESDTKTEDFKKESKKVDQIIKKFDPQLTFKTIATQVAIEGKCSYLPRISYDKDKVNFFVMQKLNSDMVKLTSFKSKQHFGISFNMAIFLQPAYDIMQYPKFIQDTWEEMITLGIVKTDKNGRKTINPKAKLPSGHMLETMNDGRFLYWAQLPQGLAWTFYSDGGHPLAEPDTCGLFMDMVTLDDYRWLQGNLLSKGVTSVLTGKIPLVKDPKAGNDDTAISTDVVLGYTDLFNDCVSANIFPFFSPFEDMEMHSVNSQPEALDVVYDRLRDVIAGTGNSALISLTEKPTVASTLAAEKIQASKNDYLTRQFQDFLNAMLEENFGLKYLWHVNLHGDIFTWDTEAKTIKEMVGSGMTGLTNKLLSFYGYSLEDYRGSQLYFDSLDIQISKDDATLVEGSSSGGTTKSGTTNSTSKNTTTTTTKSTTSETKTVGRPKLDDGEIQNDNTDTSRSQGGNVSDVKV